MKRSRLTLILWGVALVGAFGGNIPIYAQTPKNPPPLITLKNPTPPEARALIRQADELCSQGKLDEALNTIRKVQNISPASVPAQLLYVRIRLIQTADPVVIADEYRAKIAAEPENPVYPLVLSIGTNLTFDPQEGQRLLEKTGQLAPDWSWGQYALGRLALYQQDKEKALAAFRKAKELNPADPELLHRVGQSLVTLRQVPEAIAIFQTVIQQEPTFYPVYTDNWIARLNQTKRAPEIRQQIEKELEALIARGDKSSIFLQLAGRTYNALVENQAKAKLFFEELNQRYPDWSTFGTPIITSKVNQTGYPRRLVLAGPRYLRYRQITEARENKELQDRILALEALDTMPMDDGMRVYALEFLLGSYGEAKNIAKMEEVAAKIVKLDPENIGVYGTVTAAILNNQGNLRQALTHAQMLVDRTKSFTPAKRPKNYDEASWNHDFSEADQQAAFTERKGQYLYLLGWTYKEIGDFTKAEATLRQAMTDPPSIGVLYQLGLTLEKLGKRTEAARQYAKVVAEVGDFSQTSPDKLDDTLSIGGDSARALLRLEARNPKIDAEAMITAAKAAKRERGRVALVKKFINEEPKDFEVTNLAGTKVKLSSLRGKVVLMNFWASW